MQKLDLNISPIFDDFDEEKNFHRVLFNAGRSVQARELTQAQTYLQNQIERVGKHLFQEGSMVIPGGITAIEEQDYVTFAFTSGSVFSDIDGVDNLYIKSNTSGLIAKIGKVFNIDGADGYTLFVDTITPGTTEEKKLNVSDACTIFFYNTDGSVANIALCSIVTKGKGSWVKVQNGIYFVRGMFVKTDDHEFVTSKYTTDITTKVGFHISEEIIGYADDASLLSNANGFPNANAPGASRLKITLSLVGLDIGVVDANFIELARFEDGKLQKKIDYTQYGLIEKAIAQRTYETNGDYVVSSFGEDIKEHLKVGNNGGVYESGDGGDATKLVVSMKPGIGYVKGYRVENIGIQNIVMEKARDTAFLNNSSASSDYGQYFLVHNVLSLPDVDIKKQIQLLDNTNTLVGLARVKAARKDGVNHRIYIFDITFNALKSVSDVTKIKYSDGSSLFTADLVTSSLYDATGNTLVFPLPISGVQTLESGISSDTSYSVLRTFNLTTNASGVVTATTGANESFGVVDASTYLIGLTGPASAGTLFNPTTTVTLGGVIYGTSMTINLGVPQANKAIKVIVPVLKQQTTQKTKTLVTVTDEAIAFADTNRQNLAHADIYKIVSIINTATLEDITNQYTLDNGHRDSWYQVGRILKTDSNIMTLNCKVTYQYFTHSAGDYFSVDSYTGIDRADFPTYNGLNLADAIDFRPRKDASGNFTSLTVFGELLKPNDSIRSDVTYYLPRKDIICVNKLGDFTVVKGIPSLTPSFPETPEDSMRLYELMIPAYTLKTSDIIVKEIDNKRYTMRDIGRLENRIANVEYYTSLSALETKTNRTQVIDPITGNSRFKNGFAVDGFVDFAMSDPDSPEWSASVNYGVGGLHPSFNENGVDFTANLGADGVAASLANNLYIKSYTSTPAITQPYATSAININPYAVFTWSGSVKLSPDRDYWKDVKYLDPILKYTNFATGGILGDAVRGFGSSSRGFQAKVVPTDPSKYWVTWQGIGWDLVTAKITNASTTENIISNIPWVPYMRTIEVSFACAGFRPLSKLYPFFDSVSVSADCKPAGGSYGQALITDASGALSGTFLIPNSEAKKFKSGTSVFRMTDTVTNSNDTNLVSTEGSALFSSTGVVDIRQKTITATRLFTLLPGDPIAQTFRMPTVGGGFVTKIDIFFKKKALHIPVTLQIRSTATGLPTLSGYAVKVLPPSSVNVSNDASVATSFVFDDPVFLEDGVEYAMVLLADTQEYEVFIAKQGEQVIGSQMSLSKQAHTGVFLTSSNGSTWNPQQDKDMKFTVHRAVFGTSNSSVVFKSKAPIALPCDFNAAFTTLSSNVIKINFKSHGLKVGDSVTMSGIVAGNNISSGSFNGTKTVTATTVDSFSYTGATNANLTGSIGGNAILAVVNYPFNKFFSHADAFIPEGTEVSWEYSYLTQGTRLRTGWYPFSIRTDFDTINEAVCKAAGDLQLRATLKTVSDNLSPTINKSGITTVLVSPRVDLTSKIFNYVTSNILFDKPTTHARFLVGAQLPGNSGMKLYIKEIDTTDQDVAATAWVELVATSPVTNSNEFVEYEYILDGNFIGYKIKIEFTGDNSNPPSLSDVRTIAFA